VNVCWDINSTCEGIECDWIRVVLQAKLQRELARPDLPAAERGWHYRALLECQAALGLGELPN
jgi:hypothetical protein